MSIKKQYLKREPLCKVTFIVPEEMVHRAKAIHLAGEFNNWDCKSTPLKKNKDGKYAITLKMETGRDYQFRYVLDGSLWLNDDDADRYVATCYGYSENSVIVL